RIFLENLPEHPSDTKVFTMKMEILLEPTSNKLLVGPYTLSWKPCLGDSLNLPDHSLVPAKSKSYYQAFNVKSLFREIVCPKKSQVKLKVILSSDSLGMYHKKNVDFAYLMWEDFVYKVEHKDAKKSNEMYYRRFTKVIINFFMTKDPLILRRNKVNLHYVRDDQMFTMIKLVSRHQNTQQFGAMFPVELTNKDIRNSAAYKEYYAIASGAAPPKTKGKCEEDAD
nr:hypothetical protein [Tanacetum cinerariifolium]